MSETPNPPTPRYQLTLTITGNSHEEIERELLVQTRGGYLSGVAEVVTRRVWSESWRETE